MKPAALLLLTLLSAPAVLAAEKWWDAYNRGVAGVNGKSYAAAADALQKAIAANPTESSGVRAGKSIITYVPYFWLGIAKFNLGDTDGALRAWKTSEDQGAVAQTAYYPRLKDWVARAQTEKQREAQSAASGSRKEAEGAISRAVDLQGSAMSAGGDRTEAYREAQRKLQEALAQFRKAGNDSAVYRAATQAAQLAATMFTSAAEEGKKLKAAAAARPKPAPPKPAPLEVVIPMNPVPATDTGTKPAVPSEPEPAVVPSVSPSKATAELAVQTYRRALTEAQQKARTGPKPVRDFLRGETPKGEGLRDQLRGAKSDADYDRIRTTAESALVEMGERVAELSRPAPVPTPLEPAPATPAVAVAAKVDVTPAYRAFATGDLTAAEQLLTRTLASTPAAEAFLLRGCVRYTRALLSRDPDVLLAAATKDFQEALRRNRSLRLDPVAFSPKLVARFEEVRNGR